ncbi:MAG: T9SS type A sorting domain-containing protein [Bacteroidetes bacterium]|nr:T9SS type A sorting domain-containing protein [Bacteroidota bacterium]
MKKNYLFLLLIFAFSNFNVDAQSDTVQTFVFSDSTKRSGIFKFPSINEKYRKVLMLYTLKCYPKVSKYDNKYPCGEWDYLTYTLVTAKDGNVYEIGRYITPYGINLSLGPNGFKWVYDVTDYQNLLRDSVKLSAGNTQELLDLKFVFFKGTPPAEVIKINQIWDKGAMSYSYNDLSSNKRLFSKAIKVETSANRLKYRSRITGHGHNSNDGNYPHCCEWKDNTHSLYSGNNLIKEWHIWQTLDCADNPVFPQGGTWPYSREGWCPGDRVKDTEFDITKYKINDSITIDYGITPVPANNAGMGNGNYVMAHHLIQYAKPSHSNDAEIYDIISPSIAQINNKFSPTCEEPKIIIRNNSTDTISSLDIEYNVSGGYKMKYKWTGKLGFLQTQTILLPIYDAGFYRGDGTNVFHCSIIKSNGTMDGYSENNSMSSPFKLPDVYKDKMYVEFKTNNYPNENHYVIRNSQDSVILLRDNLAANKVYRDTLKNMKAGCYTLELIDEGTDGLSFWANSGQGSGYLRFRRATGTNVLKNFGTDFGYRIYYAFIIDSLARGKQPQEPINTENEMLIVPNPSNGNFTIVTSGLTGQYKLEIFDAIGNLVYHRYINSEKEQDIEIKNLNISSGLYFIKLANSEKKIVRKLIVN